MNLEFILWLILWPLSCKVGFFFIAKANKLQGKEPFSDDAEAGCELIETLIWLGIAILLWRARS